MGRSDPWKTEIGAVSDYAERHKKQLTKLVDRFDNMGNPGLFWDSKVPKEDKRFFYFFTFRLTDPEDVKAEIDKYMKFYRDLSKLTSKIGSDDSDERKLIQDLREHLTELRSTAEYGEKTTGSSAVYDLHREFVAKHEKLEHLIKRIECEAVNERKNQLVERSNRLERDLEKSEERFQSICDKFEQLLTKHREATEGNTFLERENKSLREQNQELSETHNHRQEQLETLQQKNERLERAIQELSETNNNREKQQQEKNERLEREIQEMRKQQEEMFNKNTMLMNLLLMNQRESNAVA